MGKEGERWRAGHFNPRFSTLIHDPCLSLLFSSPSLDNIHTVLPMFQHPEISILMGFASRVWMVATWCAELLLIFFLPRTKQRKQGERKCSPRCTLSRMNTNSGYYILSLLNYHFEYKIPTELAQKTDAATPYLTYQCIWTSSKLPSPKHYWPKWWRRLSNMATL